MFSIEFHCTSAIPACGSFVVFSLGNQAPILSCLGPSDPGSVLCNSELVKVWNSSSLSFFFFSHSALNLSSDQPPALFVTFLAPVSSRSLKFIFKEGLIRRSNMHPHCVNSDPCKVHIHVCSELLNAVCENDAHRARALLAVLPEAAHARAFCGHFTNAFAGWDSSIGPSTCRV